LFEEKKKEEIKESGKEGKYKERVSALKFTRFGGEKGKGEGHENFCILHLPGERLQRGWKVTLLLREYRRRG